MSLVRQGLYRLTIAQLIIYVRNIITLMTDNANYLTPTPPLVHITTAVDKLEATAEATLNGGTTQHIAKRAALKAVIDLMRQLGVYVQLTSGGDAQKISEIGMGIRKDATPAGLPLAPVNLATRVSNYSGAVDLDWNPVEGSRNYTVFITENDPKVSDDWAPVYATTKSKARISDLTPGTFYWFKVVAHGTAGLSPASEFAMGLAA